MLHPARSRQHGLLRCAMLRSSGFSVLDAAVNNWLDGHRDVTVVEVKLYPSANVASVLYYQEERFGDSV